jgi:hypothetical protein
VQSELLSDYGLGSGAAGISGSAAGVSLFAAILGGLGGLGFGSGLLGAVTTSNCSTHQCNNCKRHKYLFHLDEQLIKQLWPQKYSLFLTEARNILNFF